MSQAATSAVGSDQTCRAENRQARSSQNDARAHRPNRNGCATKLAFAPHSRGRPAYIVRAQCRVLAKPPNPIACGSHKPLLWRLQNERRFDIGVEQRRCHPAPAPRKIEAFSCGDPIDVLKSLQMRRSDRRHRSPHAGASCCESGAISPGAFIPISMIAKLGVQRHPRQRQRHAPVIVVTRFGCVRSPLPRQEPCRSISLVEVLPADPVIAITCAFVRARAAMPRPSSPSRTSFTMINGASSATPVRHPRHQSRRRPLGQSIWQQSHARRGHPSKRRTNHPAAMRARVDRHA